MLPRNETNMRFERWLLNEQFDRMLGLTFGKSFVDLMTERGRMVQTLAIKFNRNVLLADALASADDTHILRSLEWTARKARFEVLRVPVKTLGKLRSCLRESQLPQAQEARSFRKWLPKLPPEMKPFPRLDHKILAINATRLANALELNGEMTHVILHEWMDSKDKVHHNVNGIYPNVDAAMLDYMKITKPAEYKLMEIGG